MEGSHREQSGEVHPQYGTEFLDPQEGVEERVEKRLLAHDVAKAIKSALTAREELVLCMRFGIGGYEPATLEQIGSEIGLSKERVRQIESRAKAQLARSVGGKALRDYLS